MSIVISIPTHLEREKVLSKPFIYYPIEKCASTLLSNNICLAVSKLEVDTNYSGFNLYNDSIRNFYEKTFGQILLKEHEPGSVLPLAHTLHYYYSKFFLKNAFQFTFVRNPLDRFVSAWIHGSLTKHVSDFPNCFDKKMSKDEMISTFNKFVDSFFGINDNLKGSPHFGRYLSCLPRNLEDLDFIGKLETFNDDLEYVINTVWEHDKEISSRLVKRLIRESDKNLISDSPHNTKHYRNGIQLDEFYSDDSDALVRNYYREEMEIFGYD